MGAAFAGSAKRIALHDQSTRWPWTDRSVYRAQAPGPVARLEHAVRIFCAIRNGLQHIPVLDYFSIVVQPKDIHPGIVLVPRPALEAVQDDILTFGDDALDLDALCRAIPVPSAQNRR